MRFGSVATRLIASAMEDHEQVRDERRFVAALCAEAEAASGVSAVEKAARRGQAFFAVGLADGDAAVPPFADGGHRRAQKAGTTQLYAYMIKHPRVFAGAKKEVAYFSKQPDRSVAWYRSRFPLRHRVEARYGQVLEASPSYLPMPQALRQMNSVLPEARVIVLLRDPVSRAFSHYQHYKTRHLESRSFEQAVADELRDDVFPAKRDAAIVPGTRADVGVHWRGYYALQLELLYTLYPRDRVLVIDSASLFTDTRDVPAGVSLPGRG